jgi:hypothetical protein
VVARGDEHPHLAPRHGVEGRQVVEAAVGVLQDDLAAGELGHARPARLAAGRQGLLERERLLEPGLDLKIRRVVEDRVGDEGLAGVAQRGPHRPRVQSVEVDGVEFDQRDEGSLGVGQLLLNGGRGQARRRGPAGSGASRKFLRHAGEPRGLDLLSRRVRQFDGGA